MAHGVGQNQRLAAHAGDLQAPGDGVERGHAQQGHFQRLCHALGACDADAHTREGAGAAPAGDAGDGLLRHARFVQQALDAAQELRVGCTARGDGALRDAFDGLGPPAEHAQTHGDHFVRGVERQNDVLFHTAIPFAIACHEKTPRRRRGRKATCALPAEAAAGRSPAPMPGRRRAYTRPESA